MLVDLLLLGLLLQAEPPAAPVKPVAAPTTPPVSSNTDTVTVDLLKVKRIYVDSFGDDIISKELQSMIVSALVSSKRFKVTENREKADAILKGVALEKTSQELHAYGEGTSVGAASGGGHSNVSGSGGNISGSSSGGFVAQHMGVSDSAVHTETVDDARVAVRLVNPDGDVIWTSTQESKGAKYKGSSADAADKVVKQLLRDVEKLENPAPTTAASPTPAPSAASKK